MNALRQAAAASQATRPWSLLAEAGAARGTALRERHAAGVRLALADGRSVRLRPVQADDAHALQGFVRALSPSSRQLRFHIGLQELPPGLLRDMTAVDQRCHVALVALADAGEDEPRIVAEARYVVADGHSAEFALAVADDWQGRGLGSALLRRLARHAARRGLQRLFGEVLRTNAVMIAMMRRLGGRFGAVPGTALLTCATLDLRPLQ